MPDISMCGNMSCPSKEDCYRFKAVPNGNRQAYSEFKPKEGEDKCDAFWKIQKGHRIVIIKE
jgi:hypothetical protein